MRREHARSTFVIIVAIFAAVIVWPALAADQGPAYTVSLLPLGAAPAGGITIDYLAYDMSTGLVWVPSGNTGVVNVVDGAIVTQVPGFATKEVDSGGTKRILGPSSVAVGADVVYIGNRADMTVCAVDARSLEKGVCGKVGSSPDRLTWAAPTKEVWATTSWNRVLRVLDGETLEEKAKLALDGRPAGLAIDAKRGRAYLNIGNKDQTLAIDLASRETVETWSSSCGKYGPRGSALDESSGFLFVACSNKTQVLDVANGGKVLSSINTGSGVDELDFNLATRMLYVGAAGAGRLVIASVDDKGSLSVVAKVPTRTGARNAVVTKDGTVYMGHSSAADLSALIVVAPDLSEQE